MYPCALLFSINELQQIHGLMFAGMKDGADTWQDMTHKVSCLAASSLESRELNRLVRTVRAATLEPTELSPPGGKNWLCQTAKFLEDVHKAVGESAIQLGPGGEQNSRIFVHTISVEDRLASGAVFQLLRCIYKVRIPSFVGVVMLHASNSLPPIIL